MGFIGSLFGGDSGNSGGAGMNYQATGPNQGQMGQSIADTQTALQQQQMFLKALYSQNAIGNQQGVFNQQQALAGQLGQQAMGGGPNPAQAQFQQNANQVAAQAASLAGSQKGISPALQARMIAQQQAGAGQAAAGQAATLQAQQQIAAQQGLMQQQNAMANLSTQQVGQQQNSLNAYQQGALGQQSNMFGLQQNANSSNAGVAQSTAANQGKNTGGILNTVGSAFGLGAMFAEGGEVPGKTGPKSSCGRHLSGDKSGQKVLEGENYAHQLKPVPGRAAVAGDSKSNDTVPAKLSPGEIIIPRSIAQHPNAPEMAAKFVAAIMAKNGRRIG